MTFEQRPEHRMDEPCRIPGEAILGKERTRAQVLTWAAWVVGFLFLFSLFFLIEVKSYNIKLSILKYKIHWHLVHSTLHAYVFHS